MFLTDWFPRTPFQAAYLGLAAYTSIQFKLIYLPDLTFDKVHDCLLHVDEAHCGNPKTDWFSTPEKTVKLTKAE